MSYRYQMSSLSIRMKVATSSQSKVATLSHLNVATHLDSKCDARWICMNVCYRPKADFRPCGIALQLIGSW